MAESQQKSGDAQEFNWQDPALLKATQEALAALQPLQKSYEAADLDSLAKNKPFSNAFDAEGAAKVAQVFSDKLNENNISVPDPKGFIEAEFETLKTRALNDATQRLNQSEIAVEAKDAKAEASEALKQPANQVAEKDLEKVGLEIAKSSPEHPLAPARATELADERNKDEAAIRKNITQAWESQGIVADDAATKFKLDQVMKAVNATVNENVNAQVAHDPAAATVQSQSVPNAAAAGKSREL